MKKILPLSLLALSAAYMSAATPVSASLESATEIESNSNYNVRPFVKQTIQNSIKAADYSGETWTELGQGKYTPSAMSGCYGIPANQVDVVVYEAQGKPGLYKVVGVWPNLMDNSVLYVNAQDPEFVVVEDQNTGYVDNVDGITHICSYSDEALKAGKDKATILAESSEVNAYVEDGIIYFPAGCLGLRWPEAPEDSSYGTVASQWYYVYTRTAGMLILPGADYVDPWSEEVEGTMVENIICSSFNLQSTTYTVGVKKNFDTNTYLIRDAWRGVFDQIGGAGYESPSMEINASDPNNAVIELTETGINGGTDGAYQVLSYSAYFGDECPEENKITVTEDGGNTVITFPISSMLLYAPGTGKFYYASTADVSTITFPTIQQENSSIGDIIVDAEAEVEYYNLQGIRIDNPKSGQIVIKRQGNVVSKEFIR